MKIIKYIFILFIAFYAAGCDVLDTTPTDRFTEDNFWTNEANAKAALSGCYQALRSGYLYGGYGAQIFTEVLTPNAYLYDNTFGFGVIAKGIHTASNSDVINNRWGDCYKGIGRVNVLLDRIESIPMNADLKLRYKMEAKFLRALYYFHLTDVYGDVPLILHTPTLTDGTLPRTPKAVVVEQMVKDLDEAAAVLPLSYPTTDVGRTTKGAALALKAKVLLYNKQWTAAAATAKQVMELNQYVIYPDYRKLFLAASENNSEVIFDVQFKTPEFCHSLDIALVQSQQICPVQDLVDAYLMTDGKSISESPLYSSANQYKNRDPRFYQTIAYIGSKYIGNTAKLSDMIQTGYNFKKYTIYDSLAVTKITTSNTSDINVIVLRYADVLLMYAEAQNEVLDAPDASVYAALNAIRKRTSINMPDITPGLTKDQMRNAIRLERRIELAGEGQYYSDIRRWGIAETVMNASVMNSRKGVINKRVFNKDRDYLWPVPTLQINENKNLLPNNPNW